MVIAAIVIKNTRGIVKLESQIYMMFQVEFRAQAIEIRIKTSPIRLVRAVIIPAAKDFGF